MPEVNLDFEMEWQKENAENVESSIKSISGQEYEKLKMGILYIVKDLVQKNISTTCKNIVEHYLEEHFEGIESQQQALDLSEKVKLVINRMTEKENILISSSLPEDKNVYIYEINLNYDAPLFD